MQWHQPTLRTGILNTDDFGLSGDNLHFNAAGQLSLGNGFCEDAAYLEWMIDTFSSEDIDAGFAQPEFDKDGDGSSNRDEFLGGTDPLSQASNFGASIGIPMSDSVLISYFSAAGRAYSVERLSANGLSWQTVAPALRGTGARVSRPLDASDSGGIFRVCATLP